MVIKISPDNPSRRDNKRLRNLILAARMAEYKLLGQLPNISAEDICAVINQAIEAMRK